VRIGGAGFRNRGWIACVPYVLGHSRFLRRRRRGERRYRKKGHRGNLLDLVAITIVSTRSNSIRPWRIRRGRLNFVSFRDVSRLPEIAENLLSAFAGVPTRSVADVTIQWPWPAFFGTIIVKSGKPDLASCLMMLCFHASEGCRSK